MKSTTLIFLASTITLQTKNKCLPWKKFYHPYCTESHVAIISTSPNFQQLQMFSQPQKSLPSSLELSELDLFNMLRRKKHIYEEGETPSSRYGESPHLSFSDPLLDLFNSQGGRQPLNGERRKRDEVDNCFWRIEMEERQLKVLVSLLFSLSYGWQFGSCWTAFIFRASGSMQLQIEPARSK